jgi:hypothetical protein
VRQGGEAEGDGGEEPEHPWALSREGARLLGPPDRGEPGQPRRAGGVAGGAQQEGEAEEPARDPVRRPRALADLGRHGGDPGEHASGARHGQSEGGRPVARDALACEAEADDHGQHAVEAEGHEQGGRQGRVAAHRGGPHELEPAGLLLRARVADHEQAAREPGEQRREPPSAPRGEPADRAQVEGGAGEGEDRRVGAHARAEALAGRRGGVQLRDHRGRAEDRRGDDEDGHRPQDPVAPQGEAHERPRAGERAHSTGAAARGGAAA